MPLARRSVLYLTVLVAMAGACARTGGEAASPASIALGRENRATSPVFAGNESVTGDVFVLGVRAATVQVEMRKTSCEPPRGKGKVIVGWQVRTTGLVALFRDMHAEMTVVMDPFTGLPLEDRSHWATDPKLRDYSVRFGQGTYFYDYRRSDGFAKAESVPVPEKLWPFDPASGTLLLRSFRPAQGEKAYLYGVVGRHLWRVDFVFGGSGSLPYRGTKRPAVRIEGLAQRLTGEPSELTSHPFQIWFSDDPERVPLFASMGSKWGEVRVELTGYEQRTPEAPCAIAPPARRE